MKRIPRPPPVTQGGVSYPHLRGTFKAGSTWVAEGPDGSCGRIHGHVHHTKLGAYRCLVDHPNTYTHVSERNDMSMSDWYEGYSQGADRGLLYGLLTGFLPGILVGYALFRYLVTASP
jgi:hypothetical protein